jgi:hypothetical protein
VLGNRKTMQRKKDILFSLSSFLALCIGSGSTLRILPSDAAYLPSPHTQALIAVLPALPLVAASVYRNAQPLFDALEERERISRLNAELIVEHLRTVVLTETQLVAVLKWFVEAQSELWDEPIEISDSRKKGRGRKKAADDVTLRAPVPGVELLNALRWREDSPASSSSSSSSSSASAVAASAAPAAKGRKTKAIAAARDSKLESKDGVFAFKDVVYFETETEHPPLPTPTATLPHRLATRLSESQLRSNLGLHKLTVSHWLEFMLSSAQHHLLQTAATAPLVLAAISKRTSEFGAEQWALVERQLGALACIPTSKVSPFLG